MEHATQILEFLGMVFSMLGAYLMSRDSTKMPRHLYYAFISFGVANLFMIAVSFYHGIAPLLIQMVFFATSAYMGIIAHSRDKEKDSLLMFWVILTYSIFLMIIWNSTNIEFKLNFELIDTVAATIAILGSFILKTHDLNFRLNAFIAFFIADVLYVYVGYTHGMYFFMVQSAFFLYTSLEGYYNTKKAINIIHIDSLARSH